MIFSPLLRFDSLVLPPPWSALIALALLGGLAWWGRQLAQRLLRPHPCTALEMSAGFVVVTAITAAILQWSVVLGVARLPFVRAIAFAVGASTLGWLMPSGREDIARFTLALRGRIRESSPIQRGLMVMAALTLIALIAGSFGPPTDIDSISYHLSVPLDWLSSGGMRHAPDWFHARLVGLGESLNMLGLAAGSECFGSLLQASGAVVAVLALVATAQTAFDGVFAIMLVACCPLLPGLAFSSKPLLLPAAASATAIALLMSMQRSVTVDLDRPRLALVAGCAAFALACKYSFIPGAAAIGGLVLLTARRRGHLKVAVLILAGAFVLVVLPVYLRNTLLYGDPLSPMLERFRRNADPVVGAFSWYLRTFDGQHTLRVLLRLPIELILPTQLGGLGLVLGIGALAAFLAVPRTVHHRLIWLAAAMVSLVAAAVGQLDARFFLEPYLWCGLVAIAAAPAARKAWLTYGLAVQLIATTAAAIYGAALLFPASVTAAQRERVMTAMAPGYALWQWLDHAIPEDAVVALDQRSLLFARRRSVPSDVALTLDVAPVRELDPAARIKRTLAEAGASVIVVTPSADGSVYDAVIGSAPIVLSPEFAEGGRSPWTPRIAYRLAVFPFPLDSRRERIGAR